MSGNSEEANKTLKALTKTKQCQSAVIKGSSGNILTEGTAALNQQTEYCSGLYKYGLHPDTSLLQSYQAPAQQAKSLSMLREEVEEAVCCLKLGKSPGVDNTPSELLRNGAEATATVLTAICQIWETRGMAKGVDTIILIPLPKKVNLKQCQNYCTIGLISHPSKIMLGLILN